MTEQCAPATLGNADTPLWKIKLQRFAKRTYSSSSVAKLGKDVICRLKCFLKSPAPALVKPLELVSVNHMSNSPTLSINNTSLATLD